MRKIKEINLLTTDGNWWKLYDDANSTMDETIVNKLLAQMSVKAGKRFDACDAPSYIGRPMYINTSNIIAVEVVRESEEEQLQENGDIPCNTCEYFYTAEEALPCCECMYSKVSKYRRAEQ